MKVNDIRPDSLATGQKQAYLSDVDFYRQLQSEFLIRSCPGCQNNTESEFSKHMGFTFRKCKVCQSIFMSPGPTPEMVYQFYKNSENYKYWSTHIYPQSRQKRLETIHKFRSALVLRAIRAHLTDGKKSILEIGAGTGDTLSSLQNQRESQIDAYAIEWNSDMIAHLRKNNIDVVDGDIESLLEASRKFDVVLLFEVTEHLLSPLEVFRSIYNLLNPGGLLVLTSPNAASIEVQFLKDRSTSLDIEHISVLTPQAIVFLATMSNFSILEMKTDGNLDVDLLTRAGYEMSLAKDSVLLDDVTLQKIISESGLSSNMQIILQKNFDV
jgi:2-polyprenyl-3-methyl-5-hydroxy-6-metoxy-1,4-benzoquinol methylase